MTNTNTPRRFTARLAMSLTVAVVVVVFAAACSSDSGTELAVDETTTTVAAEAEPAPTTTGVQSTTTAEPPLTIPADISSASELPPEVPIPPAEGSVVITGDDTYTGDHPTTTVAATPVTPTTATPVTPTTAKPATPTTAKPATPTTAKPATPTTAKPSVVLPPIVGEPVDAGVVDTTETFYSLSGQPLPRTPPLRLEVGTLIESVGFPPAVADVVVVGFNDYGGFQEIEVCDADGHHWAAYAWRQDDGLWRIEVSGPSPYREGVIRSAWRYGGQTC